MPYAITDLEELLQKILICLTVRKGNFLPDPELGSRLFLLSKSSPSKLESLAESYVREALSGIENIQIERVTTSYYNDQDKLELSVWVLYAGQTLEVKTSL